MRHIVHIITGLGDGGAEGVLYRLCTTDTKFRHTIISLMDDGKYGPLLREAGVHVYALGMRQGRFSPKGIVRLWRLLRELNPSVIQTWMYHADLLGGILARFAGYSNVVWGIRQTKLLSKKTSAIAKLSAFLSHRIPRTIVCCAEEARKVHIELGYSAVKSVVISNGYDLERLQPSVSVRERLRSEWAVGQDTVLIGLVGRFHPQKDHRTFLDAIRLVSGRHKNFRVVLVGTGLDRNNPEIARWLNDFEIEKTVMLLGQRNDIPDIMNAIDIHVLSSLTEGFPNVIAEAMACGTPCVTTDVGDAAHIVGDTGWVVPPADPVALASAIDKALFSVQDGPSWKVRQAAARQRIAENFGLEAMVAAYHNVWDQGHVDTTGKSVTGRFQGIR